MRRLLFRTLPRVLLALAVLVPAFLLVRARFLPDVEVPVFRYARVSDAPGPGVVSPSLFMAQILDLREGRGYETVTPRDLRLYKTWGIPLPPKPCMIAFDSPDRDLVADPSRYDHPGPMPVIVEDVLRQAGFQALVALPHGAAPDGADLLSPAEIAEAEERGTLAFLDLSRGDAGIAFSDAAGVARVGPRTDLRALPRLPVPGGTDAYQVKVFQDSLRREQFGVLRMWHDEGPSLPVAVVVLPPPEAGPDGEPVPGEPVAERLFPPLEPGVPAEIPLGADVRFPLDVFLQDETGYILLAEPFHIIREDVEKAAGYRRPALNAEDLSVSLTPLPAVPPPDETEEPEEQDISEVSEEPEEQEPPEEPETPEEPEEQETAENPEEPEAPEEPEDPDVPEEPEEPETPAEE